MAKITSHWEPSNSVIEILQKAGIDSNFSKESLVEFCNHYLKNGDDHDNWDVKYVAWVRRQWHRFVDDTSNRVMGNQKIIVMFMINGITQQHWSGNACNDLQALGTAMDELSIDSWTVEPNMSIEIKRA